MIYSRRRIYSRSEVAIAGLERCSYYDHNDRTRVVEVGCRKCGVPFLEELEAAKQKVTGGLSMLCLSCDDDAGVVSCVRITGKGMRR